MRKSKRFLFSFVIQNRIFLFVSDGSSRRTPRPSQSQHESSGTVRYELLSRNSVIFCSSCVPSRSYLQKKVIFLSYRWSHRWITVWFFSRFKTCKTTKRHLSLTMKNYFSPAVNYILRHNYCSNHFPTLFYLFSLTLIRIWWCITKATTTLKTAAPPL